MDPQGPPPSFRYDRKSGELFETPSGPILSHMLQAKVGKVPWNNATILNNQIERFISNELSQLEDNTYSPTRLSIFRTALAMLVDELPSFSSLLTQIMCEYDGFILANCIGNGGPTPTTPNTLLSVGPPLDARASSAAGKASATATAAFGGSLGGTTGSSVKSITVESKHTSPIPTSAPARAATAQKENDNEKMSRMESLKKPTSPTSVSSTLGIVVDPTKLPTYSHILQVTIKEGSDLTSDLLSQDYRFYVSAKLGTTVYRTAAKSSTFRNPMWNETFIFAFTLSGSPGGASTLAATHGEAENPQQLASLGKQRAIWIPLRNQKNQEAGSIFVEFENLTGKADAAMVAAIMSKATATLRTAQTSTKIVYNLCRGCVISNKLDALQQSSLRSQNRELRNSVSELKDYVQLFLKEIEAKTIVIERLESKIKSLTSASHPAEVGSTKGDSKGKSTAKFNAPGSRRASVAGAAASSSSSSILPHIDAKLASL